MKILMINVVCGIRSTGRICTDIASALENQGHEVKIAYGREDVPEQFKKYAVRIGNDFDVNLHGLKARLFDGCGFGSKKATKRFIKWIEEYDPDVIHLHNLHGYYINIEILFKYLKTCGKRVIWTLHDCWAFSGHSALCDGSNCERWIQGCYHCPNLKEYPRAFIDNSKKNWERKKKLFSDVSGMRIVVPSVWLANNVKKSFLSQYHVSVINNGVDTRVFYNSEETFDLKKKKTTNKFVILGVASTWNDLKGFKDFLQLNKLLSPEFQIVLVGLSKKQIKELPNGIVGIQKTNSQEELADIYRLADIFVNLTYCDTYPTVNLESLACGTNIITYDTGGSAEITKNSGGIIVPKGDINQIYESILFIKSLENRNSVKQKLIKDKKETIEEYTRLLENK